MFHRLCSLFVLLGFFSTVHAIEPGNVFVLVNKNEPKSKEVAEYYCRKRQVPVKNIVTLDLPKGENIGRSEFDSKLRDPLRKALKDRKGEVKVLLSVYGVPLRVGRSEPNDKEKSQLKAIASALKLARKQQDSLKKELKQLQEKAKTDKSSDLKKKVEEVQAKLGKLNRNIRFGQQSQRTLSHGDTVASVDSELMLLWWEDYNLHRWQTNLLYFAIPEKVRQEKTPVLMVSRLDGPSVAICKRLVNDAIATEKTGLKGKVYVDARGIRWNKNADRAGTGYGGYDESLRELAKLLKDEAKMTVVLDDKQPLFKPKSCKDTALYCGWYSHRNYIDCCELVQGSVAYHIASSEAVSLRDNKAKFWCPNLLKNGACVTLGPVAEPYTIGFPKPAEFFGFLVTGKYTVVECYSKTLMLNSWMTTLVGDPLYNPYKNNPLLQPGQIRISPEGGQLFLQPRKSEESKDKVEEK